MPAWSQNGGDRIALSVSTVFIAAGVVTHQIIKNVLQAPQPEESKNHE